MLIGKKHVKVWFSNDAKVWLPELGQNSLRTHRHNHPAHTIYLVIKLSLLDDGSKANSQSFCQEHNITLIDFDALQSEIDPADTTSMALFDYANQEIASWCNNNLGSPAAASDIARILPPVLGLDAIYSDMNDVVIPKYFDSIELDAIAPAIFRMDQSVTSLNSDLLTTCNDFFYLHKNHPIAKIYREIILQAYNEHYHSDGESSPVEQAIEYREKNRSSLCFKYWLMNHIVELTGPGALEKAISHFVYHGNGSELSKSTSRLAYRDISQKPEKEDVIKAGILFFNSYIKHMDEFVQEQEHSWLTDVTNDSPPDVTSGCINGFFHKKNSDSDNENISFDFDQAQDVMTNKKFFPD